MAITNPEGILADGKYALGAGRLFLDTEASGGRNEDAGPTNEIKWEIDMTWIGLRSGDYGDRDDENVASSSGTIITLGLAKPRWDVMFMIHPCLEGEFDTGGNLIAVHFVDARGYRTEDHRMQITFKEYDPNTNIVTVDPWRIVDFYQAAAMPEKADLTWDPKTQRYFPVKFSAKPDPDHLSPSGRPVAWKIRGDS